MCFVVEPVNLELRFVWLELTATFPSLFFLFNFFKFMVIVEEAILSEDNHVGAGDLLIKDVKRTTGGSDFPALERESRRNYRSF